MNAVKILTLLSFLTAGQCFASDDPPPACEERSAPLETAKPGKCEASVKTEFLGVCTPLLARFDELGAAQTREQQRCANVGSTGARRGGARSDGAGARGSRDTGAIMGETRSLMESCSQEMNRIKGEYRRESEKLVEKMRALNAPPAATCKPVAMRAYQELKSQVDARMAGVNTKEGEYKKGAVAAGTPQKGNNDNADKMKNQGDQAKGDQSKGGGGGGGMPQFPQFPQQKKDDSAKKQQEELAKLKAQKVALCKTDLAARDTAKSNCEVEFRIVPGVTVTGYPEKLKACKDKADQDYSLKWGSTPCDQVL